MITKEQLMTIAKGLDVRDFHGFAAAVALIDPTVGETVRMHAGAADGNSPDLIEPNYSSDWVTGTIPDAEAVDGMTPAEAREWWIRQYGT